MKTFVLTYLKNIVCRFAFVWNNMGFWEGRYFILNKSDYIILLVFEYCLIYFSRKHFKKHAWEVFVRAFFFFFFLKDFIYLWKRVQAHENEHKSGEGLREMQTPHWAGSLMWDSIPGPWNHDLNWRRMPNRMSHPGTQNSFLSVYYIWSIVFRNLLPFLNLIFAIWGRLSLSYFMLGNWKRD